MQNIKDTTHILLREVKKTKINIQAVIFSKDRVETSVTTCVNDNGEKRYSIQRFSMRETHEN